jgi:hypothetical protein
MKRLPPVTYISEEALFCMHKELGCWIMDPGHIVTIRPTLLCCCRIRATGILVESKGIS